MSRDSTISSVERLLALLSSGDFSGDEARRLIEELRPLSPLLVATARAARGERLAAWHEARRAAEEAPRNALVRFLASRLLFLLGDHHAALAEAQAAATLGVTAATWLRADQARGVGWYHEARAVLETILRGRRAAAPPGADGSRGVPTERVLDHLLQLYLDANHYEGAAAVLDEFLPLTRSPVSIGLRAARIYARRGAIDQAHAAIRGALAADPPSAETQLEAARLLLEIGAFDEAGAAFGALAENSATSPVALEALGRLCLWRGDSDGALDYAQRLCGIDPTGTAGRRMRAAANVLLGECASALPLLDAVLDADPRDAEAYAWRAEAHLRLGNREQASADARHSPPGAGHSFAARALHVLAALPAADGGNGGRAPGLAAHARQEFSAELTAIDPAAARILAGDAANELAALLERALTAMRGNRTPLATWIRDDGRLARLPRSTSARVASRQALELIKVASADETLRNFDDLVRHLPDSSMPLVHRGELHLWLGNYAAARADLEGAIAIQRQTRWAWYGLACLDLLAGDPERALATCAFGITVMDNTEGPVAFSYRGEAYRLLGRLDEALRELRQACELHPRRLSSWINLALAHGAAGDDAALREVVGRLARDAPSLLSAAASELGADVFTAVVLEGPQGGGSELDPAIADRLLRHALTMMRGNRSSSCVTYFTADGIMRHVPHAGRVDPHAEARTLAELRRVLLRALATR